MQLQGKKSGGFANPDLEASADLRSKLSRRASDKGKTTAKYFGATYEKDVKLPLEAFEPDMEGYVTKEHGVTDLSYNGSAAGVWY